MPTTSNFGWTTPADTDLVKDGALAIRTLGNGIDTSFLDLKGGTTGQNLRKASNTDLDFTFAGDATNTVIDAEGDLLVGDSADTLQRLAIGTTGQVLTVDTALDGKIKWAAAAAGGKLKQVISATSTTQTAFTTTSFADTTLSATITPSSASHKIIVLAWHNGTALTGGADKALVFKIVRAATDVLTTGNYLYTGNDIGSKHSPAFVMYIDAPNTTSSTTYKTQAKLENAGPTGYVQLSSAESQIILLEVEV